MSKCMSFNNVNFKKLNTNKQQGHIEVRLYDSFFNLIFKRKAEIANKNDVCELFTELKNKGVNINKDLGWF